MFCSKCGKELKGSDSFCPNCGAKVGGGRREINIGKVGEKLRSMIPSGSALSQNRLNALGSMKPWFFAAIALLILCCVLIGKNMLSVEVEVLFYSETLEIGLFEDRKGLNVIAVIGYILAVGVMLLPVLENDDWKKIHLLPALIMPVLGLAWFGITAMSGGEILAEYEDYADISVGVTTSGWFFLITSVLTVIAAVKNYKEIPEMQGYEDYDEEDEEEEENDLHYMQLQASRWREPVKNSSLTVALMKHKENAPHYAKRTEKHSYGATEEYTYCFSRYDHEFAIKYTVRLSQFAPKAVRVYRAEPNGVRRDVTEELLALKADFKMLVAEIKLDNGLLKVKLRPGTKWIAAEADQKTSEEEVTSVLNSSIALAMED